jgi:hypothetical protein
MIRSLQMRFDDIKEVETGIGHPGIHSRFSIDNLLFYFDLHGSFDIGLKYLPRRQLILIAV